MTMATNRPQYLHSHDDSSFSLATQPQHLSFACGLVAGVVQAGVFNPYDRALYLSVKHKRHFLALANFSSPYQGFLQSIGGRALSGGLYYPFENLFCNCFSPHNENNEKNWTKFVAGTAAGAMNALLLNPLSALKYKTWGRDVNRGMRQEALDMYRKASIRPFFNGLYPTLVRDVVFGGCYTYLRYKWRRQSHLDGDEPYPYCNADGLSIHIPVWGIDMMAAAVATVVSGPFNLARNVQYATRSKKVAPTVSQVLRKLVYDISNKNTFSEKWHHVQSRLRLGWGTARVAVGMAFGQLLYDRCMTVSEQVLGEEAS